MIGNKQKSKAVNWKFLLLFILPFTSGFSQEDQLGKIDSLDLIVNQYIKEYSIVGLSIGIVTAQKSYTRSYGSTDLTSGYPVSGKTLFHTASISKLFTATAILQLVEQQQLNLEEKVVDILPDFKMKDKRYSEIKIKHLLTHSSGLMWNNNLKESPDDYRAIPLYINNLSKKKLNFKPGEKLSYETYSNVGFNLLGAIIEKKSGEKFDEYIKAHILEPLKMNRSTYYFEEIDASELAIPQIVSGNSKKVNRLNKYGIDNKKNPILNGTPLQVESYPIYGEDYEHNPSGNLISSAEELNLWINHHLKLYAASTPNKILQQSTLKDMWSTQKNIEETRTSIGWGWWIYKDDLGEFVFHVGDNPGFCSILGIYPEQNFGLVILCNGWYAKEAVWNKLHDEITKLYLRK